MALTGTKRAITIFGLIFTCLAFVCMIVCFTTPHWLERFPYKRNTKVFVRLGLWEACFNDWQYYKDYLGKRYNGCWWIFHFEYRPVWPWLNPRKWSILLIVVMLYQSVEEGGICILLSLDHSVFLKEIRTLSKYRKCCSKYIESKTTHPDRNFSVILVAVLEV